MSNIHNAGVRTQHSFGFGLRFGFALFLSLTLLGRTARAQDTLYVSTLVTIDTLGAPIKDVSIFIVENGEELGRFKTANDGTADFFLLYGRRYELRIQKKGFLPKIASIDLIGQKAAGSSDLQLDIWMWETLKGFEEALLREPVAKGRLNLPNYELVWDANYQAIQNDKWRLERERLKATAKK